MTRCSPVTTHMITGDNNNRKNIGGGDYFNCRPPPFTTKQKKINEATEALLD